jgi:hypothetical protein
MEVGLFLVADHYSSQTSMNWKKKDISLAGNHISYSTLLARVGSGKVCTKQ